MLMRLTCAFVLAVGLFGLSDRTVAQPPPEPEVVFDTDPKQTNFTSYQVGQFQYISGACRFVGLPNSFYVVEAYARMDGLGDWVWFDLDSAETHAISGAGFCSFYGVVDGPTDVGWEVKLVAFRGGAEKGSYTTWVNAP